MSTKNRVQLPIHVIVADGRGLVREGVCRMLSRFEDVAVVGGARDTNDLLELLQSQTVDVVLLDIDFPPGGGLSTCRQLQESGHPARVVCFSVLPEEPMLREVLKAHVSGFLLIDAGREELEWALYAAATDNPFICPSLFRQWLDQELTQIQALSRLDPLDLRLLELIAQGQSVEQIAEQLSLEPVAVEFRRQALVARLDLTDTEALLERVFQRGLLRKADS